MCSTHWPRKNWPGALERLAIGLVDNKYTKLGKIGEKVLVILGVGPYKSPTVISDQNRQKDMHILSHFNKNKTENEFSPWVQAKGS